MDEIAHAIQNTDLQVARTRQMVEEQIAAIERLKTWALPTESAERTLAAFVGALEILEDHERYLLDEIGIQAEASVKRQLRR